MTIRLHLLPSGSEEERHSRRIASGSSTDPTSAALGSLHTPSADKKMTVNKNNSTVSNMAFMVALLACLVATTFAATCPENTAPCKCESLSETGDRLKLDCKGVASAADAKTSFSAIEPEANVTWEFTASECSWASLPDDFFGGHSVEKIDIQECELETVSEAALRSTAGSLKDIRLMSNKLASFPFDLAMPNLDTLILYDNRFDKFPKMNYPNLRLLFLGGNLFEELPEDAFSSLPELQDLYLGGNVLRTIPANAFSALKSLRILACESGILNKLTANSLAFAQEAQVDYLILHYNEIAEIEANALTPDRFPREKFLLNSNNITTLPQSLFRPILQSFANAGKGAISVAENPLNCCEHLWLFRDRRLFKWFDDLDETTCVFNEEPIKFNDVKYRKLRADCARQRRRRPGTANAANTNDDVEE